MIFEEKILSEIQNSDSTTKVLENLGVASIAWMAERINADSFMSIIKKGSEKIVNLNINEVIA